MIVKKIVYGLITAIIGLAVIFAILEIIDSKMSDREKFVIPLIILTIYSFLMFNLLNLL